MNKFMVIENEGEVDVRAFYVMGMSSKVGDEKTIGQFGTGNKYGITALLREGCDVVVKSGKKTLSFQKVPSEFRGKSFEHIRMKLGNKVVESSMTVEMGQLTWSTEQGMRELIANALDEGGLKVYEADSVDGQKGKTRIFITESHTVLRFVKNLHHYFILDRVPLAHGEGWAVYEKAGPGLRVYRKGVLVLEDKTEESVYDYELDMLEIKEDRTASKWDARWNVKDALQSLPVEMMARILEAVEKYPKGFEGEARMEYAIPNAGWAEAVKDRVVVTPMETQMYARRLFSHKTLVVPSEWITFLCKDTKVRTVHSILDAATLKGWDVIEPDDYAKELIAESVAFLKTLGYQFDESIIKLAHNDAPDAPLGQYVEGVCYINDVVIRRGFEETLSCVTEEVFHHLSKSHDESREFQQWILDELQYQMQRLYRYLKKENKEVGNASVPGSESERKLEMPDMQESGE